MALRPIPLKERLRLRRAKKKSIPPLPAARTTETSYRRDLLLLSKELQADIARDILPLLETFEEEYVRDAYASVLELAFDRIRLKYNAFAKKAQEMASDFVEKGNTVNRDRFYRLMERSLGVNLRNVIQNEGLEDILVAKTRENVALIKSIPDEYLKQVETIVFEGTTQGTKKGSLIKRIKQLGHSSDSKAKLIARDQTSKLNSVLNQQRQENLGVSEYVWRTAKDDRVRESHSKKNGKIFQWNDPPSDTGHPGHDIQCRCVAQPIIEV